MIKSVGRKNTSRIIATMVFFMALFFAIIFNSFLPAESKVNESADYNIFYSVIADRLLRGDDYSISWYFSSLDEHALPVSKENGELITHWPPGYPIVLSKLLYIADKLRYDRDSLVHLFILVAYALISVIVYSIASQFFGMSAALLTSVIWMSYPFNLWLTKQPNSEIPYILLLYLSVFFLLQYISNRKVYLLILSSVVLAASTYIRAVSFFLPLIFVVLIFLDCYPEKKCTAMRSRLSHIAIFILVYCACILPWELFVYKETGRVIPMATSGDSLVVDSIDNILADKIGGTISMPGHVKDMLKSSRDRAAESTGSNINPFGMIWENLLAQPHASVSYFLIKAKRSMYGTDTKRHEHYIMLIQVFYLLLMMGGLFLVLFRIKTKIHHVMLALIFIYFWCICVIGLPLLRYMVPAIGLLAVYPAVLINEVLVIFKRRLLLTNSV